MPALPILPSSGTLVLVRGAAEAHKQRFTSVAELERWRPVFEVRRVQIFTRRRPSRSEATFCTRPDGTHLSYDDGHMSIRASSVPAALAAYRWAYGD